jgi:hypothetical protein
MKVFAEKRKDLSQKIVSLIASALMFAPTERKQSR